MAANTQSRLRPTLTKKETKALAKSSTSNSIPWSKPTLSGTEGMDMKEASYSYPHCSSTAVTKPDLKPMHTLTECLQLLHKLAEEVKNISQMKCGSKKTPPAESIKEAGDLESSRSLILHWAAELELNMVKKETKPTEEKTRRGGDVPGSKELEKYNDKLQQWAVELKNIKEANSVSDEELHKLLYPRGAKESRMAAILPLLEFVAWSLLSEDTEEALSMLWLPTKQKAWRTGAGKPRYIPNSVWQWVQDASVSVRLDVSSSHPWLVVSSDRLQVKEAAERSTTLSDNSQHFTGLPCVLGDTIITSGRHYWEVEVSPTGSWRVGVMSTSAPKDLKRTMSPRTGYWTLWKGSSLWACTDKPIKLRRAAAPRLIGVYVDAREGQVSFYDADRRVHIYTFSDTFKYSLVPLFVCLDAHTVLKIIPADKTSSAEGKYLFVSGSL